MPKKPPPSRSELLRQELRALEDAMSGARDEDAPAADAAAESGASAQDASGKHKPHKPSDHDAT